LKEKWEKCVEKLDENIKKTGMKEKQKKIRNKINN
jgi:hypothetical protein